MKITKHDIGAEVISILTRGMYPDPRDALREYIQNGVDAKAKNMTLKIKQDSIIIEDDGHGMDETILRKAIRVGISDKDPNKDVGFMGIGIYSAFHLCSKLSIFSRMKDNPPYLLKFNFKLMREILDIQRIQRLKKEITSEELIDLQSLLEKAIDLEKIKEIDFPEIGTRVEIVGLDPIFYRSLSNFDQVSEYLQEVVPLRFNKEQFEWAELIENKIINLSKKNNATFELINVELQVSNRKENLYRPYTNEAFHNGTPQKPIFKEIKKEGMFFGVVWGCLNSERKKISNENLRGFLLKRQGFAIGKRSNLVKYFVRSAYFDRYIGEIVILHKNLLPNAARSDLQYSDLRTQFYEELAIIASDFNENAHKFQEFSLGDEQIDEAALTLKKINAEFSHYSEDSDGLISDLVRVRNLKTKLERRLRRKSIRSERKKDTEKVIKLATEVEKSIKYRIKFLEEQKKKYSEKEKGKPLKINTELKSIKTGEIKEKQYENLLEVLEDLDIQVNEELKKILDLIDEKFVQQMAESKSDYRRILLELKKEIEDTNID